MHRIIDSPVKTAVAVALISIIPIFFITMFWDFISASILPNTKLGLYDKEFWENILVEVHGILIELTVIGVLIIWLDSRRNKNTEIIRLNEDLEDYAQLDFPEINVKKLGHIKRLNKAGITAINIQNLVLNGLHIRGLIVRSSKMIGLKVTSGTISNSCFFDVQMRSANFENSIIKNTKFDKSILLKSNFSSSSCKGVSFKDTSVERADFTNCNLQSAIFVNSDLRGVKLQGANLKQCSFQGASNIDINEIAKASNIDYISISENLLESLKILRPDMKFQNRMSRT